MSSQPSRLFGRWELPRRRLWASPWLALSAPQLFVGSFLLMVLLGAAGFRALPGLYAPGQPVLTWLEALFTSTSAICVTGLIVTDTATRFSQLGQAYILLLIQVGGLGIITFTSLIIVALGRRLSLRAEALASASEIAPHVRPRDLVRDVVRFTLVIEGAGAILLYLLWIPRFGWCGAAWPALFHSISAFCNAGFSTWSDSLIGSRQSPAVLMVIASLIVLGGLGFLTLEEINLRRIAPRTGRIFRLSLHTRIVLVVTALLIAGGWVLFMLFEWNVTLRGLSPVNRIVNALFMSVTARTAGFNTVDYGVASAASNYLTILLMMVGGSPGSTAGGLKTTTIALLVLLAWSRFRNREVSSVSGRSVPEETIQRAVGLFVVSIAAVSLGIFVLAIAEGRGAEGNGMFLGLMFECASAFNTVGLSMGVTPALAPASKGALIALMFLGRVGPLTLASALAKRQATPAEEFRYAYEDVVVG